MIINGMYLGNEGVSLETMTPEEKELKMRKLSGVIEQAFVALNFGDPIGFYLCIRSKDNPDGNADFITNNVNLTEAISVLEQITDKLKVGDYS